MSLYKKILSILDLVAKYSIFTSIFILCSCIEGQGHLFGNSEAGYYIINDYIINRPMVLAIKPSYPYALMGSEVTMQVLAATPNNHHSPAITWWSCGLSLDYPPEYMEPSCLTTSLAENIGYGNSITVKMPDYSSSNDCDNEEDDDCDNFSYVNTEFPIIVSVSDDKTADLEDMGFGYTYITLNNMEYTEPYVDYFENSTLQLAYTEASSNSSTKTFDIKASVDLLDGMEGNLFFKWYITDGLLSKKGITSVSERVDDPKIVENSIYSSLNTLIVPNDFNKKNITIYVVVTNSNYNTIFATQIIEID